MASLLLLFLPASVTFAQEESPLIPHVIVVDQMLSTENSVTVEQVVAPEPAWIAIHADLLDSPGPTIGFTRVPAGITENVVVVLDAEVNDGDRLWAVLHEDEDDQGVYEFPVSDGIILSPEGDLIANSFVVTGFAEEATPTPTPEQQAEEPTPTPTPTAAMAAAEEGVEPTRRCSP